MNIDSIAPYGRSFDEYRMMFRLDDDERDRRFIGIGDGPSNFNAVATTRGWRVVSCDPIYGLPAPLVQRRVDEVMDQMVDAVTLVPRHWVWSLCADVDALREHRKATASQFFADYPVGAAAGRYLAAALPHLPLADDQFDVALCSHLLFSWSTVLDLDFHKRAVAEMLRVAREVRIFPTGRNLAIVRSKLFDPIVDDCRARGCIVHSEWIPGQPQAANCEQLVITRGQP